MLDFYREAPISWVLTAVCVCISTLREFKKVDAFDLYFHLEKIIKDHEYWRLFTSLFDFGDISFDTLISIYMLVRDSGVTEAQHFNRRPVDFLGFVFFGIISLWIRAIFSSDMHMGHGMSCYFMYYTCKIDPDRGMILPFLPVVVHRGYLPFLILLRNLHTNDMGMMMTGFFSAQVYFFLRDVMNIRFDKRLMYAPDWLNEKVHNLINGK